MHSLEKDHFEVVYRILRYLQETPGEELLFKRYGHLLVKVYTNVDWARSTIDRKSKSGTVLSLEEI